MSSIRFRSGREISENKPPYFIAEMNTSHFGSLPAAKEMIISAKKAGTDCVKFQSWTTDTLSQISITGKIQLQKGL